MPNKNMLEVVNLSYRRGQQCIINSLSFALQPGSILQIVGPNGIGKTTLLRLLTGLLQPDQGSICYAGIDIQKQLDTYQNELFYLDHCIALKGQLTVAENILLDPCLNVSSQEVVQRVLAQFNIQHLATQFVRQLSRGQKQRVALSKIVFASAQLYILDEPFTALDDDGVAILQKIILEQVTRQAAVIISSHRLLPLPQITTLDMSTSHVLQTI